MAILPVDLQALVVRLNDASRPHQREYEAAVLTQMTKAEEVANQAQIESSRVNDVKPQPESSSKIEPDKRGKESPRGSGPKKQKEERLARKHAAAIEHPYKGRIIDTKV